MGVDDIRLTLLRPLRDFCNVGAGTVTGTTRISWSDLMGDVDTFSGQWKGVTKDRMDLGDSTSHSEEFGRENNCRTPRVGTILLVVVNRIALTSPDNKNTASLGRTNQ